MPWSDTLSEPSFSIHVVRRGLLVLPMFCERRIAGSLCRAMAELRRERQARMAVDGQASRGRDPCGEAVPDAPITWLGNAARGMHAKAGGIGFVCHGDEENALRRRYEPVGEDFV